MKWMEYADELEGRTSWTLVLFAYLAIGAMAFQLRGAILPNLKETFSVSESLLGLVAPASTISFTAVALTTGMFAGRINIKKFLVFGILLSGGATILIGFSPIYPLFLGAIALRGLTGGVSGGLTRPILGHLHAEKRGMILNMNEAVWALGASAGPLVANLALKLGNWRLSYIILGVAILPIFLIMWKMDFPLDGVAEEPLSLEKLTFILKDVRITGMAAAIFLVVGVEGGFFTWLPYYLTQFFPQSVANLTLSGFLLAYVPARLLSSWLAERVRYTTVALVSALAVCFLLVVAFVLSSGYLMIAAVIMAGFFVSMIWPSLFSMGTEAFPEHSGPINGIAMTVDPLGIATFPALMGIIAERFGVTLAMRSLIPLTVALILVIALLRTRVSD